MVIKNPYSYAILVSENQRIRIRIRVSFQRMIHSSVFFGGDPTRICSQDHCSRTKGWRAFGTVISTSEDAATRFPWVKLCEGDSPPNDLYTSCLPFGIFIKRYGNPLVFCSGSVIHTPWVFHRSKPALETLREIMRNLWLNWQGMLKSYKVVPTQL